MSKELFIKGIIFSSISRYSGILINLIVTAILSRILSPEDFGVIALATVFITFFSILSESGIGSAIIQKKDLNKLDISNIFTITIFLGIVLTLSLFFLAGFISEFYKNVQLKIILQLLCTSLFFSVANIVPNGILLKEKRFKFLSMRNMFIQFLCGIASVIYAYSGGGIYALLINPIIGSVLVFFINYFQFRIVPQVSGALLSFQKIYKYSLYQFLFTIVNYFSRNLDSLLIGRFLGMNVLGYYEKSYRLMLLPITNITNVINSVSHPVFSEYQDKIMEIERKYKKIIAVLSIIGFPLSILLFYNSAFLIITIFGSNWEPSIIIFKILSLSVGFQIVVSSAGSIFQATNNTRLLFIDGLLSTFIVVCCLSIGIVVLKSIEATVTFYIFASITNFFKSFFILYVYGFKSSFVKFVKQLLVPITMSIFLFGIFHFIYLFFEVQNVMFFCLTALLTSILCLTLFWREGILNLAQVKYIYGKFRK